MIFTSQNKSYTLLKRNQNNKSEFHQFLEQLIPRNSLIMRNAEIRYMHLSGRRSSQLAISFQKGQNSMATFRSRHNPLLPDNSGTLGMLIVLE
jgi:hypothetical protein